MTVSRNMFNGMVTGTELGNVTTERTYNAFGELESSVASFAGSEIFAQYFTRDPLGRITRKIEVEGGETDVFDYSYDLAGRLTDVVKNSENVEHYEYDDNGNRTAYSLPAPET